LNDQQGRERDIETLATLRSFMDNSGHLEWDIQGQVRMLAEQAIEELQDRI
jgi:hypothetical protein